MNIGFSKYCLTGVASFEAACIFPQSKNDNPE